MRLLLEETYFAALQATSPKVLVQKHLPETMPDLILAIGKAALPMLEAARECFPDTAYLAVTPQIPDIPDPNVVTSNHPIPDWRSVEAASRALELLAKLEDNQHLFLLISGGGSALFCAPWGVTLEEKQSITQALMRAGADITELNTVRKHLSKVKGGQLVAATKARVTALLLSDVVGDDPSIIASGISAADPSTFADALAILERYEIQNEAARAHLLAGIGGELLETPKDLGERVQNTIIGSNRILLEAAKNHLEQRGIRAVILSDSITGDTRAAAQFHAAIVRSIVVHHEPFAPPIALLSGGETTVQVRGHGKGGRNHEFALWLLHDLGQRKVYALIAGSDGMDGNSGAAGAFLEPNSLERAMAAKLELRDFLANNDSGTFFSKLNDQLITGASGHNLNDLRMIFIPK